MVCNIDPAPPLTTVPNKVILWRDRYQDKGVLGLKDKPPSKIRQIRSYTKNEYFKFTNYECGMAIEEFHPMKWHWRLLSMAKTYRVCSNWAGRSHAANFAEHEGDSRLAGCYRCGRGSSMPPLSKRLTAKSQCQLEIFCDR